MESLADFFETAIEIALRRKWIAVFSFLAAFAASQTIVTVLPELYRSTAIILVEHQQIPDDLVRSTVTSRLETRLQMIEQEVLSRSRLEKLINLFDLYQKVRDEGVPIESLVGRMRSEISVQMEGSGRAGTVAFKVGFRGADPKKVADVVNNLASFYIEENIKVREQQAAGTSEFLKHQLEEMQKHLEEMENKVSRFKATHVGELPHQQDANLTTLEQLNTRLRINSDKQILVSERLTQVEGQLAEMEPLLTADGPDATAARISNLRAELGELQRQYSDKYPDVIRLKSEIELLTRQLRETKSSEPNEREQGASVSINPQIVQLKRAISNLNVELKALQAEAAGLDESIANYQLRVETAPLREQQYQVLMRDYDTTRELYRSLLIRQKDAELAENMELRQKGEQFRIIEQAIPARQPTAPNRPRLRIMGLVLSIGLAVGIVLLLEQLDTSFHTIAALRASTRIPVLVGIPLIVTTMDRRSGYLRFLLGFSVAAACIALIVAGSYWFGLDNEQLVGMLVW